MWKFKRPKYVPTTLEVIRLNGTVEILLPRFPVKVEYVRDKFNPGDTFAWTTGTFVGNHHHQGTVYTRTYIAKDHSYVIRILQEF